MINRDRIAAATRHVKSRGELLKTDLSEALQLKPSAVPSRSSGGTAGILPAERQRATFDMAHMTAYWDNNNTARRKFIESELPEFRVPYVRTDVPRDELLRDHMEHFIGIHGGWLRKGFKPQKGDIALMGGATCEGGSTVISITQVANTIKTQASKAQMEELLPKLMRYEINGAYVQTELGHGSAVRGILTTAVYDPETETFVLNTPELKATKWWITGLNAATHGAVVAQLITGGKNYGMHFFWVQLRDENYQTLPGVNVFELGVKHGVPGHDLGGMTLENVRVPRTALLSRRQHVEPDGTYVKHQTAKPGTDSEKAAKLAFLPMLQTRMGIVMSASDKMGQCATIAARYSCVRHQGFKGRGADEQVMGAPEFAIIDYENQLFRVMRGIALAYALRGVGSWLASQLTPILRASSPEEEATAVANLPATHASTSGLKAYCTRATGAAMEDCRQAMGGHGFLHASGIGPHTLDYGGAITAEGDPAVLMLQTARFLMHSYAAARRGDQLAPIMGFLAPLKNPGFVPSPPPSADKNLARDIDFLAQLYEYRALLGVSRLGARFAKVVDALGFDEAMRSMAKEQHDTAAAYIEYFLVKSFAAEVRSVRAKFGSDFADVQHVLERLCAFFALQTMTSGMSTSWGGIVSLDQVDQTQQAVGTLLKELRPDVIPLTDCMGFPDVVLNSALGPYDGDCYERLFETAVKSSCNMDEDFKLREVPGYMSALDKWLDKDYLRVGAEAQRRARL